ncbi:hypothetical protein BCR37DRAFT_269912 [Protomyces lactucae-debilis]|uniref:RRM domain-containing protein n=1 Tax=Protomyces lactucae-debilis TaxID=2754530 RepID=A0A1Y2FLM9_PROLT|nr:uncharacterized protein BCR37DRAFT_269912 [Protomyces lactucae-debilis]ORY84477.1 hypothetical protein BCR37DRAFT_269912 [Protomyces lactucae-debilis]
MDSDSLITSPVPVHATSGSILSASIPLLDEQAQENAKADSPQEDVEASHASPADDDDASTTPDPQVLSAEYKDHASPPMSPVVAPAANDPSDGELEENEATVPLDKTAQGADQSPAEEGEYNPEEPSYASAPPSVDLQALLRSFNAQAPQPQAVETAPTSAAQAVEPPWHREVTQSVSAPVPVAVPTTRNTASDNALYEKFLVDERAVLATTAPHEFEPGARMFLGNLSSETTTKREVFFLFHNYGPLGQIALKPNFGFVQFMHAADCRAAIAGEQGRPFRDRKLQLEVSNPPRTKGARAAAASTSSTGGAYSHNLYPHSRHDSRSHSPNAYRHLSPPSYGGRQGQGSSRRRDRRQSRSRSPRRGRGDHERATYRRSPSPPPFRAPVAPLSTSGLPARVGKDIPEVQLIVTDRADPNYTYWVESTMRAAGLRTDIFFMSPKYVLADVARQQVMEGVLAVCFLNTVLQASSHVQVQVFDRSMGANNVRFEEYASLDVPVAIQLLLRERTKAAAYVPPTPVPAYGQPVQPGRLAQTGMPAQPFVPPSYQAPLPPLPQMPAGSQPADLAAVISQMDPAALQQMIGALTAQQQQRQQGPQPPSTYPNPSQLEDIMRSLRR